MACLLCGGAGHSHEKALLEIPYMHTAMDMKGIKEYTGAHDLVRLVLSNNMLRAAGVADLVGLLITSRFRALLGVCVCV